ncbi:lipoprotein LpqH [Mycobacterium sp.]|uniref:lipoprotein LpqH n=1 Tax=Mycobacterium sp. TaxID=1785 RepID=UPI002C303440|nr:lipoprotein LpqH [Mycobacterium sp.]HTQ19270.1 lipoprotein LpqH [Mycobacterium sp.]
MQRHPALLSLAASLLWVAGCSPGAAAPAPGVSLTIDGKNQVVQGSVSCSSHSAGEAIQVGEMPSGVYVHVAPQNSGIEEVKLGNSTGKPLVGRNANLSLGQDGTYDITGEAVPADTNDSSAPKPFELKIKCP